MRAAIHAASSFGPWFVALGPQLAVAVSGPAMQVLASGPGAREREASPRAGSSRGRDARAFAASADLETATGSKEGGELANVVDVEMVVGFPGRFDTTAIATVAGARLAMTRMPRLIDHLRVHAVLSADFITAYSIASAKSALLQR